MIFYLDLPLLTNGSCEPAWSSASYFSTAAETGSHTLPENYISARLQHVYFLFSFFVRTSRSCSSAVNSVSSMRPSPSRTLRMADHRAARSRRFVLFVMKTPHQSQWVGRRAGCSPRSACLRTSEVALKHGECVCVCVCLRRRRGTEMSSSR